MVTPISGSWIAESRPPHKKHPAASSGYFSLHCGHDFMEKPSSSSPDRLPDESHSGPSAGTMPKWPGFFDCRRSQSRSCGRTRVKARARGHLPAERRQPLKIEVPNQKQETLRFGRVGLIVSAGFAIGIIWPRVAGFKLVPSVPSSPAESSSADLTGAPGEAKGAAPATPQPAAEPEPKAAAPALDRLQISEPQFLACKQNGKKLKDECDHIEFDRLARPHIQALATCAGADKLLGVLSLGFDLDFTSQAVKSVKSGKSTTFTEAETQTLIECEKKEFENVSLVGIAHKHDAYSVFYKVEF